MSSLTPITPITPLYVAHLHTAKAFKINPEGINFAGKTPDAKFCRQLSEEYATLDVEGGFSKEAATEHLAETARDEYNKMYNVNEGDSSQLYESITNRIAVLGGDYSILCSHMKNVSSGEMKADLDALLALRTGALQTYRKLLSQEFGVPVESMEVSIRGTTEQGLGGITAFLEITSRTPGAVIIDTDINVNHLGNGHEHKEGLRHLAAQYRSKEYAPLHELRCCQFTVTRDGEATRYEMPDGYFWHPTIHLKAGDKVSKALRINIGDLPGRIATVIMAYVKENEGSLAASQGDKK